MLRFARNDGVLFCGVETGETRFEISDEIAHIFQSDLKAQGGTARVPFRCCAIGRAIKRDDEAFIAAP